MKKSLFLALAFAWAWPVCGQLFDPFSDGDLSSDPAWYGMTDLFVVENGELRLSDPDPGSANTAFLYLPAPTSADEPTTWEWYVRLEFAPSSSNYARLYLQASNPDLAGPESTGYFLRIGGVSGSGDALELFRQDEDGEVLLLSGAPGAVGDQPAVARIRVTRSPAGEWALWADYTGGNDLQLEGTAQDLTYPQGDFAGLVCLYTASRSDDFYFDDVKIDPLYVDQTGPQLFGAEAVSSLEVEVHFDEALEESTATDTARFFLSGGIGHPASASWDVDEPYRVSLHLGQALVSGQSYVLEAEGLLDLHGNESGFQTTGFAFLETSPGAPHEVLITEIMADPTPPVALPEAEYVELYNRSAQWIDLEGWTLSDGGTPAVFPSVLLPPGAFLLVCAPEDFPLFQAYGEVIGLPGFPGLNNGGDHLRLRNALGELVDHVAYSVDWYGESDKDDGGWSLERANPMMPCAGRENWRGSESLLGGTPGQPNSVWLSAPDEGGPLLLTIFPESPTEGEVAFSEALAPAYAQDPLSFRIEPGVEVLGASWSEEDPTRVRLEWAPALEPGSRYRFSALPPLTDCEGNLIEEDQVLEFGLPEVPEPGEVVINELLFQPATGGAEFVELYNLSEKIIDLGELILANLQGGSDSLAPVTTHRLLMPGAYVVLTERPADVLGRYPTAREGDILENDLPVLPDQGGNITVYAEVAPGTAALLDALDYDPGWHHPLLTDIRGVSLERIDPRGDSQSAGNWHSASREVGYGSPTVLNSQFVELPEVPEAFELLQPVFSPDGDGWEDFLMLQYGLDRSGYTASIRIFDVLGRFVCTLAENELLGKSGHFRWDGVDGRGQRARMGIYVIWIQWVHPEGVVREVRRTCVLAGRL